MGIMDRRGGIRDTVVPFTTAMLGVALAATANSLPYQDDSLSINDFLALDPAPWANLSLVLPILAGAAIVLLVFRSTRGFAAGILFSTGLCSYLLDLQRLVSVTTNSYLSAPGTGQILGIFSSIVIIVSGMLAASRVMVVHHSSQSPAILRGIRVACVALSVALAIFSLIILLTEIDASYSITDWSTSAIIPVGLAVGAGLFALGLHTRTLQLASGMLLTAGLLLSLYHLRILLVFAGSFDSATYSTFATIGLAVGILIAGSTVMALIFIRKKGPPGPMQLETAVKANRLSVELDGFRPPRATHTTMTRYLCTAAHLDPNFAKAARNQILDDKYRALAPSFGIDLKAVLHHCVAAYRRHRIRDISLALLGIPILLLLVTLLFTAEVNISLMLWLLLAGCGVVAIDEWIGRYHISARKLSRQGFDPQQLPRLSAAEEQWIDAVVETEPSNVTIYGSYQPFVGSGSEQGGWSFALSVLKGKHAFGGGQRLTPEPFEIEELYDVVQRNVQALELDGIVVEDRLYVDGQEAYYDDRFALPGQAQLRTRINEDELRKFVRAPEPANRVYRCIRIHGWEGEFVLSMYLNFTRAGRGLFAQARYFLLLPIKDEYSIVDRLGRQSTVVSALAKAALTALRPKTVKMLLTAPFKLPLDLGTTIRRWYSPNVAADPKLNYGATTSVRELAQASRYRRYFQQLDRDMIGKIVERQILDSIVEFLEKRNIDTSEVQERQTAILNNGLIISGGTVQAESVAVGSEAQSVVSRIVSRFTGSDSAFGKTEARSEQRQGQ